MSEEPRATVRKIDGQLVLDDPDALAMIRAVGKVNCKGTLTAHYDAVERFMGRFLEADYSPDDVVIVLINVDDPQGRPIAELLMPGHDWQAVRDQGMVPYARGLAGREGMQEVLDLIDKDAAQKLKDAAGKVALIVVDHQVAEVFSEGDYLTTLR